jgi:hypothetical protein
MNVGELIEILKDYPGDTEIEMGIIAPVTEEDQIAVDRYPIEGVLPWEDDESSDADGDEDGEPVLWLIGGEEEDVEAFLDAINDDETDQADDEADDEADAEIDDE